MNNKLCPKCKSELPKEANFCPYCMTKLIAEDGTEIPVKKNFDRKKLYIIIAIQVAVIICMITAVVLVFQLNNKATGKKLMEGYEGYLGVWYDDEHKDSEDVTKTGGKKIEICKVDGDEIIFSVTSTAQSDFSQTARLDYLKITLKNGQGNFSFSDDGFGNSGSGIIKLENGKVYAKIELESSMYGGKWDLSMNTDFTQVKNYEQGQTVDIDGILDKYEQQKIKLGARTDVEKGDDYADYTFSNGIVAKINNIGDSEDDKEPYIKELDLDYKQLKSDYKYCYKGVDDTCDKKTVKELLAGGEFSNDRNSYQYKDEETFTIADIYFNAEGYVQSIKYYWWT